MTTRPALPAAPLAALLLALLVGRCTDSKQAAPAYSVPKPAAAPIPPSPTLPVAPSGSGSGSGSLAIDCDPAKDFAALDFPPKIQSCLTQDKLYNFDADACTTMGKALWPCDYATLTQNLGDLELSTAPLDKEKAGGGKLIGCGASNDGYRIVAQFFERSATAAASDCAFSKQGKVVSVCFQKFTGTAPAKPATDAGKLAYVAGCMTE